MYVIYNAHIRAVQTLAEIIANLRHQISEAEERVSLRMLCTRKTVKKLFLKSNNSTYLATQTRSQWRTSNK